MSRPGRPRKPIFELFDCTDDPNNVSVGIFRSMKEAVDAVISHPPTIDGYEPRVYWIKPRFFGFRDRTPARMECMTWKQVRDDDLRPYFFLNATFDVPEIEAGRVDKEVLAL